MSTPKLNIRAPATNNREMPPVLGRSTITPCIMTSGGIWRDWRVATYLGPSPVPCSPKLALVRVRCYADSSRRRLRCRRARTRVPHWEPHQAADWLRV